jgi:hypothetical protein
MSTARPIDKATKKQERAARILKHPLLGRYASLVHEDVSAVYARILR